MCQLMNKTEGPWNNNEIPHKTRLKKRPWYVEHGGLIALFWHPGIKQKAHISSPPGDWNWFTT